MPATVKGILVGTSVVKIDYDDLANKPEDSGLTGDIKDALLQIAQKVAYIDDDGQDYYNDLLEALYPLSSISAVYTQSGTVYTHDDLDVLKPDLVVTATYDDGSTATIAAADYTLSGSLTVGTSTITVTYRGKTTTFTVTVTQGLPSGYTKFDYIQNATRGSKNSYVHTTLDYTYGGSDYEHIVEFCILDGSSTSGGLFGLRNTTGAVANSLSIWSKYTSGADAIAIIAAETDTGYTLSVGTTKKTVKITHSGGNTIVYLDNTAVITAEDKTFTVTSGKYFSLFGVTTASSANSGYTNTTNKFYGYTVRKISTDTIVAKYIPCTNASDEAGFYDLVGQSFITADGGASNLTAGNDA